MISDLKLAFRQLGKTPGFAVIAILTLALGIGANSAIFSVIDAVLLRPLPYPKPHELVAIWSKVAKDTERETESFPDFADLRDQSQTLESMTAYTEASSVLGSGAQSREMRGLAISSDVFRVAGVQPFRGRGYTRAEDVKDARAVVLSYDCWQRDFNSDPSIVGREIKLSMRPLTVLGIMPRGFRFPVGHSFDYMMPLHPLLPTYIENRGGHFLRLIGRLKPGISVRQANAELAAIASRLERQYPDTNTGRTDYASSLREDVVGDVRPALLTLLGAVLAVLLIACANVANLLLARSTARRREIAIRAALGASRFRIVRQLLAEGLLLAIVGGAAGLLLASWGIDLLRVLGPTDVPRLDEVRINSVVVAFTLTAAVFSTLVFGAIPSLHASRPNVNESLQEGSRGAVGPESRRLRNLLVISQVALSMLLLAGAGLLIKSFSNLRTTNPGFDPVGVFTAEPILPGAKYSNLPSQWQPFFDTLLDKLRAVPGVEAVGGASPLPFSGNDRGSSFWIESRPDPGLGNHPDASHLVITGDYFRTMHIPLLAGRNFDRHDGVQAPLVAMINEEFARKFFPGSNPLGQHLRVDQERQQKAMTYEVIGVVGSTRHETLAIAPVPEFYINGAQEPSRAFNVVLRTSLPSLAGIDSTFGDALRQLDPDVSIPKFQPMSTLIGTTLAQPRFHMTLLGCFAGVALVLAAIGIYGVIAYNVTQRTREIGIRMALGAQRGDMLRLVLRQSFGVVAIGLAAGLLGALGTTRLLRSLLYGVSAQDISIFAVVLLVLSAAALIASYLPARRATKIDPIVALRHE